MKLLDRVCTVAWAIRPEALDVIIALADRQDLPEAMVRAAFHHVRGAVDEVTVDLHDVPEPPLGSQAVAARPGTPIDGAVGAYRRGSTAVVPVLGPIVRYGSLFTSLSGGATSVSAIAGDVNLALDDPSVQSILLHVDSPGGESNGIAELADMLYAARGRKPIVAYVSDLGASAGYWLASAADEIVLAETAAVGSIGVVAAVRDPDKDDTGEIEFVSSVSPNKRVDVRTDHGAAQIQALVDTLGQIFVGAVARNRGVAAETVEHDYGQGGLLVGRDAVAAGLADRLGSFEGVLTDLAAPATPAAAPSSTPAAPGPPVAVMPLDTAIHDRRPTMGLRERLVEMVASIDAGGSADSEAAIIAAGLVPDPQPITTTANTVTGTHLVDPDRGRQQAAESDALRTRLAAAEAENQRLRMAGIEAAAIRFTENVLADGRAMPAEQDAISSLYVRAAIDDMYTPVRSGPSRLALVEASYAVRQTRQNALSELVEADVLAVLHDKAKGPKRTQRGEPMSVEREEQLLAMTDTGRRVLAQRHAARGNGTGGY